MVIGTSTLNWFIQVNIYLAIKWYICPENGNFVISLSSPKTRNVPKKKRTLRSRQTSSLGDQGFVLGTLNPSELWAFLRSPALIYRNFLVSFQCSSRKVTKQRQSKQIEEDYKRKKATKVPMNNFLAFGYRTDE